MSIFNFSLFLPQSQRLLVSKKGFLLVEAGVAVLLVGLLSMGIVAWYTQVTAQYYTAVHRLKAVALASSCIEEMKAKGYGDGVFHLPTVEGYTIHCSSSLCDDLKGYALVHIDVAWGKHTSQHVKLVTGILL